MPKGSSNRPGRWVSEPYQVAMMDAMLDPEVREVVCKKSTQIGWSDGVLNNIIGYFIDHDPRPIMLVQPGELDAKGYSKKRIAPMIQACPSLRDKVRENISRKGGNSILLKEFDGGFLKMTGAGSGKGLRGDPVAILLLDEMDAYDEDVDGEGDPIEIATRRTDTFPDAKIFKGSTPAKLKGQSKIDEAWLSSSQQMYHVPCPFCGFMQPLLWRDPDTGEYLLLWEKDDAGKPIVETVRFLCKGCRKGIPEQHKRAMVEGGRWIAKFPERRTIVGFYLNVLYTCWKDVWGDLAVEWKAAQENQDKLKTFINLRLGETWEGAQGDLLNANALVARQEPYPCEVPASCAVLIGAIDVQDNRLECLIMGFGAGEEAWLIEHKIIWDDPGLVSTWDQADDFLLQPREHQSGALLTPSITFVDSGSQADSVYDFVEPRQGARRRVFASKGVQYISKPGLVSEGTAKKHGIRLFTVATFAAKDRIFSRLKIVQPGPGYIHFHEKVTEEFFEQLTGEKKIEVRDKRTRSKKSIYFKTYNRNEALDLTVYCYAALFCLQNVIDPVTFRDLGFLAQAIQHTKQGLTSLAPDRKRKFRSRGLE
jgi:phage terminase large subunit GpA-like protein